MTQLVTADGERVTLDVWRWRNDVCDVEWSLLRSLPDPVLDIGCGPGRVAEAFARHGRPSLGVDTSPAAVQEARRRGVAVLERSVFDPLPGEGRWGAAVLLDGNIGIGGDPEALLRRIGALLRPGGVLLVEVDPPGHGTETSVARLEARHGDPGPWFPWARVDADHIRDVVSRADCDFVRLRTVAGRWFATASVP